MTKRTPSKLDLDQLAGAQERIERAELHLADWQEEVDHSRRHLDNVVRTARARGMTYEVIRNATGWSHNKITRVASEPLDPAVNLTPKRD